MSHVVSGIAQRRVIGSSARKAVLMYMAGCASDDGSGIWASKTTMAEDLEMSKRTIHSAIADMIEMGVVSIEGKRPCRNGFTLQYCINIDALSALEMTRAADAPVQQMHPTRAADAPVQQMHPTRAADAPQDVQQMHPNLHRTIHEPFKDNNTPASVLLHFADAEAVDSFLAYRRKHKSKALTLTAAKRLGKHLAEINERGGDASDALGMAEERGWASVEAHWYFESKGKTDGKSNRGSSPADSTLRAISIAARMR